MNTADRRVEIISILLVRRHVTAKELADEFHVTVRTIQNDIQALSLGFPIYTKQGSDGGIFMGENYKPYMNTLTPLELKALKEMYELADGIHRKILFQIIRKYGPENLEL
ncbi:MAG: helix-turn-helix transcriptional regulator [Candidatus Fimousia sp.]